MSITIERSFPKAIPTIYVPEINGARFREQYREKLLECGIFDEASHLDALDTQNSTVFQREFVDSFVNMFSFLGSEYCALAPLLFIENYRIEFLKKVAGNIYLLDYSQKRNIPNNSHCFVVNGPKGVGKSLMFLATALTIASMSKSVIPIYICVDKLQQDYPGLTPVDVCHQVVQRICSKYTPGATPPKTISDIVHLCDDLDIKIKLLIDEFHTLYKNDSDTSRKIISQMRDIGNCSQGPITASTTGSSSALYELCLSHFTHTPIKEFVDAYPLYRKAPSLNDSRYTVVPLGPVIGKQDFQRLVRHCLDTASFYVTNESRSRIVTKENMSEHIDVLATHAGGLIRTLNKLVVNGFINTDDSSWRRHFAADQDERSKAIHNVLLEEWDRKSAASPSLSFVWDMPVMSIHEVAKQSGLSEHEIFLSADKGTIVLFQRGVEDVITFAQPLQLAYLLLRRKRKSGLSFEEMMEMLHPVGDLGKRAERTVMRCFHGKNNSLVPVSVVDGDALSISIGELTKGSQVIAVSLREYNPRTHPNFARTTLTEISGRDLSPALDRLGFDRMILSEEKKTISLIQIKLCDSPTSTITLGSEGNSANGTARHIVSQLAKGIEAIKSDLQYLGETGYTIIPVLVTNRLINQESLTHFATHHVRVLGRTDLYSIWSEAIKALDYGRGIYEEKK